MDTTPLWFLATIAGLVIFTGIWWELRHARLHGRSRHYFVNDKVSEDDNGISIKGNV